MVGDVVRDTEYAQAVTAIYEFGNFGEIFLPTPQIGGGYGIMDGPAGGETAPRRFNLAHSLRSGFLFAAR